MSNKESEPVSDPRNCNRLKISTKFKIILVGDGGTGKSSFIDRLNNGSFRKEYIATLGIIKHEVIIETTIGTINATFYDTAGQEKIGPLRDNYYEGIDAAILFFDVASRVTYKNIPQWHKDIIRVCSSIPVALCANKIDINPLFQKVKSKNILYHKKCEGPISLFEISVKEEKNLKEPVEYLFQKLLSNPSLRITTESWGNFLSSDVAKLQID